MKRVQLVVTGKCEEAALHLSLQRLFPGTEFVPPIRVHGFTSDPLAEPPQRGVIETIRKFAEKVVRTAEHEHDVLVIGVDDQEFEPHPDRLVAAVVRVVGEVVASESSMAKRERLAAVVAERCSFHLLVPMVEAYFFGDPEALKCVGTKRRSLFDSEAHDVEAFEVSDAGFLDPPALRGSDWCTDQVVLRSRHPKRYLKYLTGDGTPMSSAYKETLQGRAALAKLDWRSVGRNASFARSARALIADIADWLERPSPVPGAESALTARGTNRQTRVLRNAG